MFSHPITLGWESSLTKGMQQAGLSPYGSQSRLRSLPSQNSPPTCFSPPTSPLPSCLSWLRHDTCQTSLLFTPTSTGPKVPDHSADHQFELLLYVKQRDQTHHKEWGSLFFIRINSQTLYYMLACVGTQGTEGSFCF